MSAVDQAIADGVGERGVADHFVPRFDWQLTGDEGGGALVAVLDHLEKIAALGVLERSQSPAVDDQKMSAGEPGEELAVGPVAAGHRQILIQARGTQVMGREPGPAGPWAVKPERQARSAKAQAR